MSACLPIRAVAVATSVGCCVSLHAQTANPPAAVTLPQIQVTGKKPATVPRRQARRPPAQSTARALSLPRPAPATQTVQGVATSNPFATPPIVQRFQLPNDTVSTTAKQIEQTVNLKDPEDAIKYFPSLFVRKRNDGDNQAVLATRTWGLNSSARTLIYEDDLLVSALIGNNNSGASPHWNLIVPEAIARVDFIDGPYAAMYPGNSMGGVLLVTTKMPDKFEADIKQTVSIQPWHQYDTKNTYADTVTSMFVGNRNGRAVMVRRGEFPRWLPAAFNLHHGFSAAGGYERNNRRAQQAGRRRGRGRHRRAYSHAADVGQLQGGL